MYSIAMANSLKTTHSVRPAAALLVTQHKGRGAVSQPTGRFERVQRQPDADWRDERNLHDEAERAFPLIGPSILTAAASMAAATVTPDQPMPILATRPGSILKPSFTSNTMLCSA